MQLPQKTQNQLLAISETFGQDTAEKILVKAFQLPAEEVPGFVDDLVQVLSGDERTAITYETMRCDPVDPETFLFDPFFLGIREDSLYPVVREAIRDINNGEYIEAVLTGGIGSAKTTVSVFTQLYQVYLLSCYNNPQRFLGIQPSDEIVFIIQSLKEKTAKVDYNRMRALAEASHYFSTEFPFAKHIESEMRFPHNIKVFPVSGALTAAIGQNVFSGIIDEINFMAVTEDSKQARGEDSQYNQAAEIYQSITMRRQSRFLKMGKLPGVLCMASSRNYPGQFTDLKEEEAARQITEEGKTNIYIYDKRIWEVDPDRFSGKTFAVFVGDISRKPRILKPEEVAQYSPEQIVRVPLDFKADFQRDIFAALRDIAGQSTQARNPYMPNTEAIAGAEVVPNLFEIPVVDFEEQEVVIDPDLLEATIKKVKASKLPYVAVHIDLSLSGDATGFSLGYSPGFKHIHQGDRHETLPRVVILGSIEIVPPPSGEIEFANVRELVYLLAEAGLPIKWISFDSFQSFDSIQILRGQGYATGQVSMDKTMTPYTLLKAGLYDGRVFLPESERLQHELKTIEFDPKKQKIDHPPNSTKDIADSVAGVNYVLYTRRELWANFGVDPGTALATIKAEEKKKAKIKEAEKHVNKVA